MSNPHVVHGMRAEETYQLDSDEYDSEDNDDDIANDEYAAIVDEAENGYTDEEMTEMVRDLKERGLFTFLRRYLAVDGEGEEGSLRRLLLGFGVIPPGPLRDPRTPNLALLPYTKLVLSRILRKRLKLSQYNTVQDAIDLLRTSKNIIVLSGAGISTSCGIPDFRSSTGLYASLQAEGNYDLDDPQQMFDIHYFREHPEVFFSFAKQIYPSNFVPSPCHRWIKLLEDRGVLLRNYTQNIDTLESLAGVTKVLQCHGSFATASCLRCKTQVPGQSIESYIMASEIPYCGTCRAKRQSEIEEFREMKAKIKASKGKGKAKATEWDDDSEDDEDDVRESEWGGGEPGIIKPDITFFGQALDSKFDECLFRDREVVDLLVIMGTSLKVAPVSEVLSHIPHSVPQIFINLTPVTHVQPDISLLGDADSIVTYLSKQLGWTTPPPPIVHHPPIPKSSGVLKEEVGGQETLKSSKSVDRVGETEDLVWRSGVGLMSHIHLLVHKSEIEEDDDLPNGLRIGDSLGDSDEHGEVYEDNDEGAEGGDGVQDTVNRIEKADCKDRTEIEAGVSSAGAMDIEDGIRAKDTALGERPTKRSKLEDGGEES